MIVFTMATGTGAAKIMRLSSNLPLIVEIVDTPQNIEDFLPIIEEAIQGGMVTIENIRIRLYRDT